MKLVDKTESFGRRGLGVIYRTMYLYTTYVQIKNREQSSSCRGDLQQQLWRSTGVMVFQRFARIEDTTHALVASKTCASDSAWP